MSMRGQRRVMPPGGSMNGKLFAFLFGTGRRKLVTGCIVVLLCVFLFPVKSVIVPEWKVRFVDQDGQPFKRLKVAENWYDGRLQSSSVTGQMDWAFTDDNGYVSFPERSLTTVYIAEAAARKSFLPYGRIGVMGPVCDLTHTSNNGAMYSGKDLPDNVVLKYSNRDEFRKKYNAQPNPACADPEAQAKAADDKILLKTGKP
jgi:hypothetical protein